MSRALVVVVVAVAACRAPAPIASCDDNLRGVYVADRTEQWMVLDDGARLEAYPITPDVIAAPGLEVAPRMLVLSRAGGIAGTLQRRYLQHGARCDARAAVHVTRCAGDTLELVVAGDPALPPPLSIAPCQLASVPSQVVRWHRR